VTKDFSLPTLTRGLVEPELCKSVEDSTGALGHRDLRDCGEILLHLVTKTKPAGQHPDSTRYSSKLGHFIDSTTSPTATATALRQVCASRKILSELADDIALVSQRDMAQKGPRRFGVADGNVSSPLLRRRLNS
jgi:hypothetical protein